MIGDLMEIIAKLEDAPPVVSGILASFAVPWGRTYRQWDTKGRLWIWMNRAELLAVVGPRIKRDATGYETLTAIDIFYV